MNPVHDLEAPQPALRNERSCGSKTCKVAKIAIPTILIVGAILVLAGTIYWGVKYAETYANHKIEDTKKDANDLLDQKIAILQDIVSGLENRTVFLLNGAVAQVNQSIAQAVQEVIAKINEPRI